MCKCHGGQTGGKIAKRKPVVGAPAEQTVRSGLLHRRVVDRAAIESPGVSALARQGMQLLDECFCRPQHPVGGLRQARIQIRHQPRREVQRHPPDLWASRMVISCPCATASVLVEPAPITTTKVQRARRSSGSAATAVSSS
jgi:hypothetical protein